MQVEPSTRFANRALDSGELFLRRRSLYPAELRVHVPNAVHYSTHREKAQRPIRRSGKKAEKRIGRRLYGQAAYTAP